jgi:hypothetical protein
MARVRDTDRGMKKLLAQAAKATGGIRVDVGILNDSDRIELEGQINNLTLGQIHEFGSETANIPERSFLRSTYEDKRSTYQRRLETIAKKVVDPKTTVDVDREFKLLGVEAQGHVREKFRNNDWPELKDPTRRGRNAEGRANPLLDTGQLRASIEYAVRRGEK